VYFRIMTDTPTVGYTVFLDAANQPITIIDWRSEHPVVEVRGILSKRRTADYLSLSTGPNSRFVAALSGNGDIPTSLLRRL
jgi:hypothetical protein